jgi:hypothetical protein
MDMVDIRLVVREGESRDDGGEHVPPSSGGGHVPQAEIGPGCAARTGRPTGLGDESTRRNELRLEAVAVS